MAVVVAVLALLAGLSPANTPPPEVFATGPGGHGVFRWDGGDATGWTRIGAGAKALRAGPAGLFAIGLDDRLFSYSEILRWSPRSGDWRRVGGPAGTLAVGAC